MYSSGRGEQLHADQHRMLAPAKWEDSVAAAMMSLIKPLQLNNLSSYGRCLHTLSFSHHRWIDELSITATEVDSWLQTASYDMTYKILPLIYHTATRATLGTQLGVRTVEW